MLWGKKLRVYNDHKKYTTALITLNKPHTLDFIKKNRITSAEELVQKLKEEMLSFDKQAEFKGKFPSKWIPSNFQVIEEEFSEAIIYSF